VDILAKQTVPALISTSMASAFFLVIANQYTGVIIHEASWKAETLL